MKRVYCTAVMVTSLVIGGPTGFDVNTAERRGAFRDLILAPELSDNLALLFSQLDTEIVLCLEGERRGPDLHVTDFRMPHILVSEQGRVQAAGCRVKANALGTWHNHPPLTPGFVVADPTRLARNCYLSRTDIDDFRRREDALISVVSCAPGILAFWKRSDIERVADDVTLLPPPDGQLVSFQSGGGAEPGGVTQARQR